MTEEIKDHEKEVEVVVEEELTMADLMDQVDKSMKRFYPGDVVEGVVLSVNEEEVMVSLGAISDGIITLEEFSEDSTLNPPDIIAVGDRLNVMVVKTDDGSGNMILSRKRAEKVVAWDEMDEAFKNDSAFIVTVKEVVKGGVVSDYKGIRVFIPVSKLSASYVEDMSNFLNIDLKVKLIEYDREKRKIVASRREIEREELDLTKGKVLSELKIGEKRSGTVTRLADFGAFVDIGGADGLLHISEMSFKRIMHPSEVLAEGDKIEVSILDIDKEKGKIALKLSDTFENPWNDINSHLSVGDIVNGKITRLLPFGAIMELESGLEGLIHISKISENRINKPSEVLAIGDEVTVAVLDIKAEEKRISFSIVDALGEEANADYNEYLEEEEDEDEFSSTLGDLFKDKLGKLKF